jgi:hypothetical protein
MIVRINSNYFKQILCFWTLSIVLFLFKTHSVSETVDSVSVFRWNLLSWGQSIELVPISRHLQQHKIWHTKQAQHKNLRELNRLSFYVGTIQRIYLCSDDFCSDSILVLGLIHVEFFNILTFRLNSRRWFVLRLVCIPYIVLVLMSRDRD